MNKRNTFDYHERLADVGRSAEKAQSHSELNRSLILAVLIVVSSGFIGLLFTMAGFVQNSLAQKHSAYMNLSSKIESQSGLIKDIHDAVFDE